MVVLESADDLRALPACAVFLDVNGAAWQKTDDAPERDRWVSGSYDGTPTSHALAALLPGTLLHPLPAAATTPRAPVVSMTTSEPEPRAARPPRPVPAPVPRREVDLLALESQRRRVAAMASVLMRTPLPHRAT